MNSTTLRSRLGATPAWYSAIVLGFVLLALLPTLWTQLDLDAAALFVGDPARISTRTWWWVRWINAYAPAVFRIALGVAFLAWLVASWQPRWVRWRLPLAFVVLAGILGPGAVVNWGFKEHWQRARPYQVQAFGGDKHFTRAALITDQCDNNCSFVSGHVSCGVFLIAIGLVHRRRRMLWAATGVAAGLVIGFARMSALDHWLSDVLWAYPIVLVSSWLVWQALLWLYSLRDRKSG